ncbi:hypothetical protein CU669_16560 [Paramagnetospirillum kuznetsovii]|uniref:Uncharacterized protein n=1 Tax=Paramagnetospirillum kuznetsovii TaxID=2053833 RepID=A0A364NUY3_9PROT|nr:hypothetical protein CU669_16560 [Paramagnetospirillum kuznetsovii]
MPVAVMFGPTDVIKADRFGPLRMTNLVMSRRCDEQEDVSGQVAGESEHGGMWRVEHLDLLRRITLVTLPQTNNLGMTYMRMAVP